MKSKKIVLNKIKSATEDILNKYIGEINWKETRKSIKKAIENIIYRDTPKQY